MKAFLMSMALAVLTSVGAAEAQQRIAQARPISPDAYIKIWSLEGSVRVIGWDRDTVAVTGTADAGAGSFFLHGDRDSGKIGFQGGSGSRADLEVRVPARSTVWVKTSSASVEVSGVTGAADLYSVTGRIQVNGQMRQLYAESMGGGIELVASAPSIRAKTGGGSIRLRGSGADVSLSTVDGSMSIAAPQFQRGRFESISGNILFDGDLDRGGSTTFQSHSGTVELRLPATASLDFLLSTYEGEVQSDFAMPPFGGSRDLRGSELAFSNGSGGADVTVRTYSGRIVLRQGR